MFLLMDFMVSTAKFLFQWHFSEHFVQFLLAIFNMVYFLDIFKLWHFHSPSNEVIWLKKISNYMQGLKSAILAIFQRAGMAVAC